MTNARQGRKVMLKGKEKNEVFSLFLLVSLILCRSCLMRPGHPMISRGFLVDKLPTYTCSVRNETNDNKRTGT